MTSPTEIITDAMALLFLALFIVALVAVGVGVGPDIETFVQGALR